MIIGTLGSAGSLKFDCLINIGAQLQSLLFSKGTAFCNKKQSVNPHAVIKAYLVPNITHNKAVTPILSHIRRHFNVYIHFNNMLMYLHPCWAHSFVNTTSWCFLIDERTCNMNSRWCYSEEHICYIRYVLHWYRFLHKFCLYIYIYLGEEEIE